MFRVPERQIEVVHDKSGACGYIDPDSPGERNVRSKLRPPRNVLALFIAVAAVLVAAFVLLSWRLLQQDGVWGTRLQERLERAADLIVASLDLGLSEIEIAFSTLSDPGDHALSVSSARKASRPVL